MENKIICYTLKCWICNQHCVHLIDISPYIFSEQTLRLTCKNCLEKTLEAYKQHLPNLEVIEKKY